MPLTTPDVQGFAVAMKSLGFRPTSSPLSVRHVTRVQCVSYREVCLYNLASPPCKKRHTILYNDIIIYMQCVSYREGRLPIHRGKLTWALGVAVRGVDKRLREVTHPVNPELCDPQCRMLVPDVLY